MRERVALYDGDLETGPQARWLLVRARLPRCRARMIASARGRPSPVREGFRLIIEVESDIEVVGEAGNGVETVEQAEAPRPDVILMDIRMPAWTASPRPDDWQAGVAARRPHAHNLRSRRYLYDAMKAGASGFLLKDARRDQLYTRSGRRTGERLLAPALVAVCEDFCRHRPGRRAAAAWQLTGRELECCGRRARLSNAEIAKELFLSGATVKTHLAT